MPNNAADALFRYLYIESFGLTIQDDKNTGIARGKKSNVFQRGFTISFGKYSHGARLDEPTEVTHVVESWLRKKVAIKKCE